MFLPFFVFFFSLISKMMKRIIDFFPVIETRLGVTDTPGRSCKFDFMDRENALN